MPLYDFPKMLADLSERMDPLQRRAFHEKMAAMDRDLKEGLRPEPSARARGHGVSEITVGPIDAPEFASRLLAELHRASAATDVVVLVFPENADLGDHAGPSSDFIDLIVTLSNLARTERSMTVARVAGPIGGALLEVALRCDVLAIDPASRIALSLQDAHGPGCYAALSERIGFVACERLFRLGHALDGRALLEQSVARHSAAAGPYDAGIADVLRKASALIAIYAALRRTFPVTRAAIATLHAGMVGVSSL
jgi:hypothetical protein